MTIATCSYCGTESDSRLVKKVEPPAWEDGGMACCYCRNKRDEVDAMHEQDRIDAARWRALRPFLCVTMDLEGGPTRWVELKCVPFRSGGTVDEIVNKLVRIAQEKQP